MDIGFNVLFRGYIFQFKTTRIRCINSIKLLPAVMLFLFFFSWTPDNDENRTDINFVQGLRNESVQNAIEFRKVLIFIMSRVSFISTIFAVYAYGKLEMSAPCSLRLSRGTTGEFSCRQNHADGTIASTSSCSSYENFKRRESPPPQ